jgi:1-acyl-sn-glycerol-3-phosphate acyltransferase
MKKLIDIKKLQKINPVKFNFRKLGLGRLHLDQLNLRKIKIPKLIRIDPFGNLLLFKRALISILAAFTYSRFGITNKLKIEGTEHLIGLPERNVLFISNHQTYYADVMAIYHVFASVKWQFKNSIKVPMYVLMPRVNSYYIAAEETMKQSGLFPRILSYTGAITVKRSWRAGGKEVDRNADIKAPDKIKKALSYGWVVNFPQGTTKPYAPVRKGTAHMIKIFKPIVVPVVINGFNEAFDKKGLKVVKPGTQLSIKFKKPIIFDENVSVEEIQRQITELIEQVPPPSEKPQAPSEFEV